jgi:hypothetical protein
MNYYAVHINNELKYTKLLDVIPGGGKEVLHG